MNGQIQYFLDPFTPDGSSADPAVSTASALAGDDAETAVSRTLADDAETAGSQTLADDAEIAGSQTLTGDGFSQPVADDVVVDTTDAVEEGDEVVVELSGDELEQGTDQGSELDGELPVGEKEPPTELGGEDGGDDAVLDDAVELAEGDETRRRGRRTRRRRRRGTPARRPRPTRMEPETPSPRAARLTDR